MEDQIRDWQLRGEQLVDIFCRDPKQRQQAATDLAYIGIRIRHESGRQAVRGDLEVTAESVLPSEVMERLWQSAQQDDRRTVQCEAVFAMGELGGQESVDLLVTYLKEHELSSDSELHRALARALAKLAGPTARDYLLRDPSPAG